MSPSKQVTLSDGSTLSIESIGRDYSPQDSAFRQCYAYTIVVPADEYGSHGAWRYDGNDIRSSCGAAVDVADMLRTLVSFLGAAAETYQSSMRGRDSENSELFPPHVAEWAYGVSDELSMLAEDPADRMRELGAEHGTAAGSWVVDGNTSIDTLRTLLSDDYEWDNMPAPLSGEWSDGPSPRDILAEVGVTEDDDSADDLLSEYETAFSDAYIAEAQRSAGALLPADDSTESDG